MLQEEQKTDKPSVKVRVRNKMPLHLIRGKKQEIYTHNEVAWLTPVEAKKYQHLIEVIK